MRNDTVDDDDDDDETLGSRWAPGTSARVWNVLAWITAQYRVFGGERLWEFVMVRGGQALGAVAGWCEEFAARAEAWGKKDRKWRRKRRKAMKNL